MLVLLLFIAPLQRAREERERESEQPASSRDRRRSRNRVHTLVRRLRACGLGKHSNYTHLGGSCV